MSFRKLLVCLFLAACGSAHAEPYFAVQQGLKCAACHVNPAGGGMRNTFGDVWGQTMLPARHIATDPEEPWVGEINRFLSVGGNLRAEGNVTDTPHQRSLSSFDLQELRVYGDLRVIADRLSIYVDQRLAPGSSTNGEAYGRFWLDNRRWYVQAGQMYLPYGLRLQDDTAFIRQAPGINFATPDRGAAVGLETARWSAQLAVTNGTAGGPATEEGKQYSLRGEHVRAGWRAGASLNINDAADGERRMGNIFGGVRTGPVSWLAEADYIVDESFTPRRKQTAGLIEADWSFRRGHNLKITGEYFDPDTELGHDQQDRFSIVYEYTPVQFAQVRMGVRNYDGIPQNDLQNRRFLFVQLNGYF